MEQENSETKDQAKKILKGFEKVLKSSPLTVIESLGKQLTQEQLMIAYKGWPITTIKGCADILTEEFIEKEMRNHTWAFARFAAHKLSENQLLVCGREKPRTLMRYHKNASPELLVFCQQAIRDACMPPKKKNPQKSKFQRMQKRSHQITGL